MLCDERDVALAGIRRDYALALGTRALVEDARPHDIVGNAQYG